jgi:integrase
MAPETETEDQAERGKIPAKGRQTTMRGDGIFERKDREGRFLSWVDAQGRRRKRKAKGFTLGEARAQLEAEHLRVRKALELGFTPPGKDSFAEVSERYLAHQRHRLTAKEYERQSLIVGNHLKPFYPGRLADIRRADIQRYVTERSGRVSPGSVRKELNTLKHLFALAVEWEIVPINPTHAVKSPKVPAGRVRYLQPTELRALVGICPDWLNPIVCLAVTTGMRRGEILGLRWLDVDFAGGRIMLPQTKNGEGRIVYLNKSAMAAFRSLDSGPETKPTDRLFSATSPEQVSVAFQRACRKAGIADFHFHDLRHTAASWLRMAGADIHTVALILGHKDLRMAARYQHLSPAFMAEAVGRLDPFFGLESPLEVPRLPEAIEVNPVSLLN